MQFGWTQSSKNWTLTKNKLDTIITYNFEKNQLMKLRVYVTELEESKKLYEVDKKTLIYKDSVISTLKSIQINYINKISYKDSIILYQKQDLEKLEKFAEQQQILKDKYKKIASKTPYIAGGSVAAGFILCLILRK